MGNEYNAPKMTRFYTVKEVAEVFRVTPNTVYGWIREGKLEAYTILGRVRIAEKAVNKIMEVR